MAGKTVVITGATDGIGKIAAARLFAAGARLAVIARDPDKAAKALVGIEGAAGSDVPRRRAELFIADLANVSDVARVADEIAARHDRIDVLINNAGVMKNAFTLSPDGYELNIAVNHLAVQALTLRLLDRVFAAPAGRVVNVNSAGHAAALRGGDVAVDFATWQADPDYDFSMAYSRSKLASLMFTYELAARLAGTTVTVNALNPGSVRTALGRELSRFITEPYHLLFSTTPEKGAEPILHLASSPEVAHVTGAYFDGTRKVRSSAASQDTAMWRQVWNETVRATGVDGPPPAGQP